MVATVRTSTLLAPSAVRLSPLSAPRVFPRPQQARVSRLRAEPETGNTAVQDRPAPPANAEEAQKQFKETLETLPPDAQKQLSNIYLFLVQNPGSVRTPSWPEVQAAYNAYQTLIWRPAELLNGRMAMLGFSLAVINESLTGQSVFQQLYYNPFAYLFAYGLVVAAALTNRQFGSPSEGISVGPVKFSRYAELWNGRMAMIGYVALAYTEYNVGLRRAAIAYLQHLNQLQVPGITA